MTSSAASPTPAADGHPPAVLVSAVSGQGCDDLLATVAGLVDDAEIGRAHV